MNKCEHRHKKKIRSFGTTIKAQCKKEAKMQDENGRFLCKHHFNRWFKKMYNEDYDTFIIID